MIRILLYSTIFSFLFSFLPISIAQARKPEPRKVLKCGRTVSEVAAIPELDLLVRKTKPDLSGILQDVLGKWQGDAWGTLVTANIDLNSGGFNTHVVVGNGKPEYSQSAMLCYWNSKTAAIVGSDGVINAFIEVNHSSRGVEIKIAKATKSGRPDMYVTFERKEGPSVVTQQDLSPQPSLGRSIQIPRAPASEKDGKSPGAS